MERDERPTPPPDITDGARSLSPADRQAKVDDAYRRFARGLAALPPAEQARRLAKAATIAGTLPSPVVAWINGVLSADRASSSQPSPDAATQAARIVAETERVNPGALDFIKPEARIKANLVAALTESGVAPGHAVVAAERTLAENPDLLARVRFFTQGGANTRLELGPGHRRDAARNETDTKSSDTPSAAPSLLPEDFTPAEITSPSPSGRDPWRGRAFDAERESELLRTLDAIESATPDSFERVEKEIQRLFGKSSSLSSDLILIAKRTAGLNAPEETALDPNLIFFDSGDTTKLRDIRETIRAGQHFDPDFEADRIGFAAFEDRTGFVLRETEDGRIGIAIDQSRDEPHFTFSRATMRAITANGSGVDAFSMLSDFMTGKIDRDTLEAKARILAPQFDLHVFGLGGDAIEQAVLAAADLMAEGKDPAAVSTILASAFNPDPKFTKQDIGDMILDMLPIVGNYRSLGYAINDFENLSKALEEGDYGLATLNAILFFTDTLGVLPGVGTVFKPGIRGIRKAVQVILKDEKAITANLPDVKPNQNRSVARNLVKDLFPKDWWKNLSLLERDRHVRILGQEVFAKAAEDYVFDSVSKSARLRGRVAVREVVIKMPNGKEVIPDIVIVPKNFEHRARSASKRPSERPADVPKRLAIEMDSEDFAAIIEFKEVKTGAGGLLIRQKEFLGELRKRGQEHLFTYFNVPYSAIDRAVIRRFLKGSTKLSPEVRNQLNDALSFVLPDDIPLWAYLDTYARLVSSLERQLEERVNARSESSR